MFVNYIYEHKLILIWMSRESASQNQIMTTLILIKVTFLMSKCSSLSFIKIYRSLLKRAKIPLKSDG